MTRTPKTGPHGFEKSMQSARRGGEPSAQCCRDGLPTKQQHGVGPHFERPMPASELHEYLATTSRKVRRPMQLDKEYAILVFQTASYKAPQHRHRSKLV